MNERLEFLRRTKGRVSRNFLTQGKTIRTDDISMVSSNVVISEGSAQSHTRGHTRVMFSVPFSVKHLVAGFGIRTTHGMSLDISDGGMGAIVEGRLCVGEAVVIDLVADEKPLRASAIVRHASGERSGFEFLGLSDDERRTIREIIGNA